MLLQRCCQHCRIGVLPLHSQCQRLYASVQQERTVGVQASTQMVGLALDLQFKHTAGINNSKSPYSALSFTK
jgi:hypothetical protein